MYGVKVILATTALCCLLAALILLWNESLVTCGYITCKFTETIMIITSLALTREVAKIKTE